MTSLRGCWPEYHDEEIDAVVRILRSGNTNYWSGNEGHSFETEFSDFCNTKYAVCLMNGTVALELALRSLGIGYGDEVVVTPRTFIASVSSIVMVGAIPVFADVDLETQNITIDTVKEVLTERTKGIIAVHLAGWPCDMDELMQLASEKGISVIEDCAQAHGARYKGRPVGGLGHVAVWSFCQDKIMTTGGEGGMITTNDDAIMETVWSLKDHGKRREAVLGQESSLSYRWVHDTFGTNARMTEMQAAIGRLQLKKVEEWSKARKGNAERIMEVCEKFPKVLRIPRPEPEINHAWYKCYVFVKPEGIKSGWDRDRLLEEINRNGVPCFMGSCPEVYLEKAFDGTKWRPEKYLPVARQLGETSLMFQVHPTLSKEDIDTTCSTIEGVLGESSK